MQKCGEHTGPVNADVIHHFPWYVPASGLCADECFSLQFLLRIKDAREGRPNESGHASTIRTVSTFWFAPYSCLFGPRGHSDWQRAAFTPMEPGRLQVPAKRKRRRLAGSQSRACQPNGRNNIWSYNFVCGACANGQTHKYLTVLDEFTRECLAIDENYTES